MTTNPELTATLKLSQWRFVIESLNESYWEYHTSEHMAKDYNDIISEISKLHPGLETKMDGYILVLEGDE